LKKQWYYYVWRRHELRKQGGTHGNNY